MFKRNVLVASLALAGLCSASAAMADVNGGGASLPAPLYKTSGVLTAGFTTYESVGSGSGKLAFLNDDVSKFPILAAGGAAHVHYAGSDSKLTTAELKGYADNHQAAWGPLIQVPSVATSVAIPFNSAGTALNLTTADVCGIFSGQFTNWNQVSAPGGRSGDIKVLYRAESSGTSELLTRFLLAKCEGNRKPAVFNSTFATAYPNIAASPNGAKFVAVSGTSEEVMTELNKTAGAITYMSPDWAAPTLDGLGDATKVAQVNGVSPAPANVSAAIGTVTPPTTVADQNLWVPVFGDPATATDAATVAYPTTGYPILGFTNLIFSQCYADANQTAQVRTFFGKHYGALSNNDAAITANRFVPLPAAWKKAVRDNFVTASSNLSIGNTNVCNAIGRPL